MSKELAKQNFIHKMGPYYTQAAKENDEKAFFDAVFRTYLERWPVDAKAYLDLECMKYNVRLQCKVMLINVQFTIIYLFIPLNSLEAPIGHKSMGQFICVSG